MSAPYNNIRHGVQVGIESSYLTTYTFGNTTAVDAVLCKTAPDVAVNYEYDGAREAMAPGHISATPRVGPSGRFGEVTLEWELAGPNVGVTATKFFNGHRILRLCGLNAGFASSTHSFTPTPDGSPASGAINIHRRGMLYAMTGCYGSSLTMSAPAGRVPTWSADIKGVLATNPTQVALPTLGVYTGTDLESLRVASVNPPKIAAGAVSVHGVTHTRVSSVEVSFTRDIQSRALDNATGAHGGFTPGRRSVSATLVIEQQAIGTVNWRQTRDQGTLSTFTCTVGDSTGNRYTISTGGANTCQIVSVEDTDDGPTAMVTVGLEFFPTTPNADDEIIIACS